MSMHEFKKICLLKIVCMVFKCDTISRIITFTLQMLSFWKCICGFAYKRKWKLCDFLFLKESFICIQYIVNNYQKQNANFHVVKFDLLLKLSVKAQSKYRTGIFQFINIIEACNSFIQLHYFHKYFGHSRIATMTLF